MDEEADWDYFVADELEESAKARRVKLNRSGRTFWVPKKVSDWQGRPPRRTLVVEAWFARKEGMHDG